MECVSLGPPDPRAPRRIGQKLAAGPTPNLTAAPTPNLAAVPDLHGMRFCRACADFLPLSEFPRGQRRYICRAHLWERTGRRAKGALLAKPRKRLLSRLWMQCYRDRVAFGQPRVALTQADIDSLLGASEARLQSEKCGLAVVPRDPRRPLARDNAALVSGEARRRMLEQARAGW